MTKRYVDFMTEILNKKLSEKEEKIEILKGIESFLRDSIIPSLDFNELNSSASKNEINTFHDIENIFSEQLKENPLIKPFLLRQISIAYKFSLMGSLGRGNDFFVETMKKNASRIYSFYDENTDILNFLSSFYSNEKIQLTNDFVNSFAGNFVSQKFKNEYKKKLRENIRKKHLQNAFVSKIYFINNIAHIGLTFNFLALNENDIVMHVLNKNLHLMDLFSKDDGIPYEDTELELAKNNFLLNMEDNIKKYSLFINEIAIDNLDSLFNHLFAFSLPYSEYNIEKVIEIFIFNEQHKAKEVALMSQHMNRF